MEHELVCPQCRHGDELRAIENARVERALGSVTTVVTEFLDLVKQDDNPTSDFNNCVIDYFEIGVHCGRCSFTHIGDDWPLVLAKGEPLSLDA